MSTDNTTGPAGFSPDLEVQARRLSAYLRDRYPKVTQTVATMAAFGLASQPDVDLKALARRLASSLATHGVTLKHSYALEAASQMVFGRPWLTVRTGPAHRLKILPLQKGIDETTLADWRAAGEMLVTVCNAWMANNPDTRWFKLGYLPNAFLVSAPLVERELDIQQIPIAAISPVVDTTDWMIGAADAIEYLRRHLEETRRALIDGAASLELCVRHHNVPYDYPFGTTIADACNSELVLRREDIPDLGHQGYEVVRGDELTCWNQFVYAIRDQGDQEILIDSDGAWCCGEARFTWLLQTLRPKEFVPGLMHRQLSDWETTRLLHRYLLAQQIFKGSLPRMPGKKLEILSQPADEYAIEKHQVLLALSKANITWEAFCQRIEQPGLKLGDTLPTAVIYSMVDMLDLKDADIVFARPQRADLVKADSEYIQALMPRIDHVRYRVETPISTEARDEIKDAVEDFSASLMMRKGIVEHDLPDLVYSGDGADLLGRLEGLELVAYVGVRPHLHKIPPQPNGAPPIGKYAFGHSLYLAIDRA